MERKELGKIQAVKFGFGGYQDIQFGISFTLGGEAWGVGDFIGGWGIEPTTNAQWTHDENVKIIGDACLWLRDALNKANKKTVDQLQGIPIEATFDGNLLKSWRILTEVL